MGCPICPARAPTNEEWHDGLTAMRRWVAARAAALIVLGGQLSRYKGRMPGMVEEVRCAVEAGKPVYLLGGFGGAAAALCGALGLLDGAPALPDDVPAEVRGWTVAGTLRNGLTRAENETLARSTEPTELAALVLRGLAATLPPPD